MPLLRKTDLKYLRNAYENKYVKEKISEIVNQYKGKSKKNEITIFLSHKHSEREILVDVITFFNSLGVKIYVDWLDEEMPSTTSGYTALRIRNKIKENKKFILVATNGAINSKWCNWELGYGDSQKWVSHIAILPIVENDGSWKDNEYLQIYPKIKKEDNTGNIIVESNIGKKTLIEWLKN